MCSSSDPAGTPAVASAPRDSLDSKLAIHDALLAKLDARNKATLFDVLHDLGISHVAVSFDGYGDSGQIESIDAHAGDETVDLPGHTVAIATAHWGDVEPTCHEMTLREAVEALAYHFLERDHGGWENNEGAYGEFVFDVAERSITLDCNERYSAENYTHSY